MGGQVADHGEIVIAGEHPARFRVTDVQKNKGGKFMHYGKLEEGTLKIGDTVRAQIDGERRRAVMRAHSATHLLDARAQAGAGGPRPPGRLPGGAGPAAVRLHPL